MNEASGAGGPDAPDVRDGLATPRDPLTILIPALLCYVPLLLTQPGWVGADTKTYLYLDPSRLLAGAPYVWNSQIGLGTVTHQNIGYLFPMGPFFWLFDRAGVPDWIAQRLWLGSVLFGAAMGVRYLLRTLGWGDEHGRQSTHGTRPSGKRSVQWWGPRTGGVLVACIAYMFSPYLLAYSARESVILLPWSALPWFIALTARAMRHGGWRYPAWIAFGVLLVGGINATALIMVGIGPLVWIFYAVWVDREVTPREALAAVGRIGVLTVLTSMWWIAGLWAEGRFGLPVIRYTETYRAVASTSTAPEVLRGLGYWFFYGNDKLGPWIEPSEDYTTHTPLLVLSYALPVLALVSASLLRWRYRSYFLAIIVLGALAAVGGHPWDFPSVLGAAFKAFTRTDAGLSLRSTPRAVPLVVLGTAIFLGAGVDAIGRRVPRSALPAAGLVSALLLLNFPPMFNGTMVANNLKRPEAVPDYWTADAKYLDSRGDSTRVLEIPGAEFASYRWGTTIDPILPGMMDRSYVARELFTWGSPPSANLLIALDRRLHEETMDPAAIAPIARLMAAGDVNVRSDMQYERYRIARPRTLWSLIRRTPGLDDPVAFGPPTPNIAGPQQTMIDEVEQGTPHDLPDPPPVASFGVKDALPIVRTEDAQRPLLMAADGDGLVDAASIGLVDPNTPIFYSASFANDPAAFDRVYSAGADLALTDTNRKRARRWGSMRENTGYTERAGEVPGTYDPTDQRLDVFPGAGDDAYTVSEQRPRDAGTIGATVTATGYGNPITYTPDDRPANALDGDPLTAWRVGAIADVQNEKLFIDLDRPVTTDHINLLQPINLERTRWITKGKFTFDDDPSTAIDVNLDDISRDESGVGQDVNFGNRTFHRLTFEVLETNLGPRPLFDGVSGVGFAEVRIPGVGINEVVRMPTDLLAKAGASSRDHALSLLFSRLRSNPAEPVRTDEEVSMARAFSLPTDRTFSVEGQARLSAYLHDDVIDHYLGMPDAEHGGVTAKADVHLPGNLRQRASAAIDGDPKTFWTSIYQKQVDHWLEYTVPKPLTFDHLDLQVASDGRHSVPTRMHLTVDGAEPIPFDIPPIADQPDVDSTTKVTIPLPHPVTGSTLRFTIDDVRKVSTLEWYSDGTTVMPVSIAEIGVPGLHLDKPGANFDSGCVDNVLSVDGKAVSMQVKGTTDDALDKQAMPAVPCGPDAASGVAIRQGDHVLRTGIGRDAPVGIDLDRLALRSGPGGGALTPVRQPAGRSDTATAAHLTVTGTGRVSSSATIDVSQNAKPFWLIMGQSWNSGWHATVNGNDLGAPTLINGYANGWYVDPTVVGTGTLTVSIDWAPQRVVWVAIAISIVATLAVMVLLLVRRAKPRRRRELEAERERPELPTFDRFGVPDTRRVTRRTATIVASCFALFVALNVPTEWGFPLLAIPGGLALWFALQRPRTRGWLALTAATALGLAGAYIFVWQRRYRYNPNFVWPTLFSRVNILGVVAILLLGAEAVRDILGRPREAGVPTDGRARADESPPSSI